ncbi:hypothetical protein SERLA73DRAFT_191875 [Serpula lacrymans var. lacrymans S7.3]|uniref:NADAR domain-containing protein n=1 Tax=Serpula lacrymans var. lacrymans (strain S7.3) TaxID=936435 RepID=F8QIH8_SERL3|nr:hypothetical protein SERLA73DRAFT_191875 [Serpula lacrymans var. lacrymans S7.3]
MASRKRDIFSSAGIKDALFGNQIEAQDADSGKLPKHPTHSRSPSPMPRERIYFYNREDPYYSFTNFYPSPIKHEGKIYPTSEHLFQSLKFLRDNPEIAEYIRKFSDNPRDAFNEAHRHNDKVRSDWLRIRIDMMDLVIGHKFRQHKHLKDELQSTGDAELFEDSPYDAYWGIGRDGTGENQLGKALERLRTTLREEEAAKGAKGVGEGTKGANEANRAMRLNPRDK